MMQDLDFAVSQLRAECSEDFVGIWQVLRLVRARTGVNRDAIQGVVEVVKALLADPKLDIGQFDDGVFKSWPGDDATRLDRLERELRSLGRDADIGDVAWLVERSG